MNVVEINVVHSHLLQTALKTFVKELGTVVDREGPFALVGDCSLDAELGGQEDVGTTLGVQLEPFSNQDLVIAVSIGRVPVCIAELPGPVQKRQALFIRPW